MKILIAAQYYFPYISGLTVYAKILAEKLSRDHDVSVITLSHDNRLYKNEEFCGVYITRINPSIKYQRGSYSFLFSLKFYKEAQKADVINIHLPFFEAGLLTFICKKILKKPVVITYHCDMEMKPGFFSKLIEKIYYFSVYQALKLSNKIISNSQKYIDHSRVKDFAEKNISIHPPSSIDIFCYDSHSTLRSKLNIKDEAPVIGFLGRLTREKGLETLIRSLPLVLEKYPNAICLISGEDTKLAGGRDESVRNNIEKIIIELELSSNVIITGYIEKKDLGSFYRTCTLLAVPSNNALESFGIVQLEAMAHNVPVISSDLPGINDLIKTTGFGELATPDNPKSLAKGIIKILEERNDYTFDAENFKKSYSPAKTSDLYESTFKEILPQGNFSS